MTSMTSGPLVVSSRTRDTAGAGVVNAGSVGVSSRARSAAADWPGAVSAKATPAPNVMRRSVMGKRIVITVVGIAAMVTLAVGSLMAGPNRFGFSDRIERHMFPEVTTGPAEPAWSPDGQWIAFSMQGDIWKVPAGGGEAIALTQGPAYHFEPDWSPDGRSLALTMDVGGNLEIGVVPADGGAVRRLASDAAVDLGPVWARDGQSILFVSSRNRGFDILRVALVGEAVTPVATGQGDQIQPAVSPDGATIAFVAPVRNKLGTGGIWTQPLAGGEPTLLQYEESEYRMRPRWTPDGQALVYGSDERESNDIAMIATAGGNPFIVTPDSMGEFSPAVSPDGSRVAFISNHSGPMTLYTAPMPGGPRTSWTPVTITSRGMRTASGRVRVQVLGPGDTAMPARVTVTASDGRSYSPDAGFARVMSVTETHYFHTAGEFEVQVPAGAVTVTAVRGVEYSPATTTVTVAAGATVSATLRLARLTNLPSRGWYSGDTHAHDLHQGRFGLTHRWLFEQSLAEDLHVTNVLIHMDGMRLMGRWQDLTGEPIRESTSTHILQFAGEFRGSLGHIGLLGIKQFKLPLVGGAPNTPYAQVASDVPYLDDARAQGGIAGFMHPYLNRSDAPNGWAGSLIPVDMALGKGDFYDVNSVYSDELASAEMYYRLLNCGFRMAATGGTDNFPDVWRDPPPGTARTYAKVNGALSVPAWLSAIKAGRTFSTNAPLVTLTVNGQEPGAVLTQAGTLEVSSEARSIAPFERLEIIANGVVAHRVSPAAGGLSAAFTGTVSLPDGGWVAARVVGGPHPFVGDSYVFAQSSPIYVEHDGRRFVSKADAAFLGEVVDAIKVRALRGTWRTSAERDAFANELDQARAVYSRLAR